MYCRQRRHLYYGPERNVTGIVEFLNDVNEHPALLDSKISDQDREKLDSNLQIDEFDRAVKEIKTNTSPGIDGISNRFIKKILAFFPRTTFPLCKLLS
jgi:hypothetical protein